MDPLPAVLTGSHVVARVAFLSVELDRYRDHDGSEFERVVIRHPGAVAVVPIDDGHVIFVRQFRAPLGALMLEIPAGILDIENEPLEMAATRECEEETGYRPGRLEHLRTINTTPGFSDERIDLFLATDLTEVGARPDGIEERHAEIIRLSFAEVRSAIADGSITDAKTLIGLLEGMPRWAS
ncbi:MAG: NUDIX hydrolase [Acidimicrobiia bacterium]|nr:NUDIX hydrolase [Acidimicrobiia bacterium]